jgi:hypothetical protein
MELGWCLPTWTFRQMKPLSKRIGVSVSNELALGYLMMGG